MRLALVALVAFAMFASEASAGTVTLRQGKDGHIVRVRVGDTILVVLDGNDTTPYWWRVSTIDRRLVTPHGFTYKEDPHPAGYTGVPGVYTFHFTARAAGSSTLGLRNSYLGKGARPVESFTVHIVAR